jgi:hypothetical protein
MFAYRREVRMHRREMREERRACRDAVRGNLIGAAVHQQRADRIHFQRTMRPNLGVGAALGAAVGIGGAAGMGVAYAAGAASAAAATHGPSVTVVQSPMAAPTAYATPAPPQPRCHEGCLHEGWLFKRAVSATIYKNWKRRWLVVWPDRIEWRDAPGAPVKGAILLDEAARLTPSAGLYMVVQRGEAELMLRTSCAMDLQVWWDAIAEALRGTAVHPHRPGDVVVGAPITAEPVVVAGLPA